MMLARLYIVMAALGLLCSPAAGADDSAYYGLGLARIDCSSDGYNLYTLSIPLPDELIFLIGESIDQVQFLSGTDSYATTPASNGEIAIHRDTFSLVMKKPTSYLLDGTLEVFSQRRFCTAIQDGIYLTLADGTSPIATFKLVGDESGVGGNQAADILTLDRIGRRYYDTFKFFLSSDFEWLPIWRQRSASIPFPPGRDWIKYYSEGECSVFHGGDADLDAEIACNYLGNAAALEDLVSFMNLSGLNHQSRFPTRSAFRLGGIPATATVFEPAGFTKCLEMTAKAGGAPVYFCLDGDNLHIADVRRFSSIDLGIRHDRLGVSGNFGPESQ